MADDTKAVCFDSTLTCLMPTLGAYSIRHLSGLAAATSGFYSSGIGQNAGIK